LLLANFQKRSGDTFGNNERVVGSVLNHGEGVCSDPGKRDATLGVGGPSPPGRGGEHQSVPDSGGGKT
jgi:hypothetical protein